MSNELIPSSINPFWGKDENEEFLDDIEQVCKKYGFNEWFIAFGQGDKDETTWQGSSKSISEGLDEFVELCQEYMREQLDQHGEPGS